MTRLLLLPLLLCACARQPPPDANRTAFEMDRRTPLPLLPMMAEHQKQNMRSHLSAVQTLVTALARDDFEGAERAAHELGPSAEMQRMCNHMGAGAPGFTPTALAFHRSADDIAKAAKAHDRAAALSALGTTLGQCVGCHATYKQQIVDDDTWRRLTAMAPH
jgi:cytochrome c556